MEPLHTDGPQPLAQQLGLNSIALRDLLAVLSAVICFFGLSVYLELSEKFSRWGISYENWQIDELPLTLLFFTIGLTWFAFRRVGEAKQEITERIRAQNQVGELLRHNRELSQRLIQAQENERRSLARELHDQIGQDSAAIRAEASYLIRALRENPDSATAAAQRIAHISENLYLIVKDMLHRLRPAALDEVGLEAALQELCENWENHSGIACTFFPKDIPADLDDTLCICIYRIVQEGLTNVMRHAGASQVRIDLHHNSAARRLTLKLSDNGRGMAYPKQPKNGFGILGMRERVAALSGNINLISGNEGQGLLIEVVLPATGART